MKSKGVVKTREKIFYGLGDMGNNIAYGAVGFYLVFFLTDVAGISPVWAGYIFMIIRMWNSICDLVMGVISDHTKTRFGSKRPYLLFGAIPLGIGFAFLWFLPFDSMTAKIIYYTLIGIFFNTLYSLVSIPYNALLPQLSKDYDERTSISGFKMAFSFVGSLLSAMGVSLIVDMIYPGKSCYAQSYPVMGRILGLVLIICILLAFMGTKERVKSDRTNNQGNVFLNLKSLGKLKEFRMVLGVFIFNMVAFDIIMAFYVYYMKYVLRISESLTTVFMAVPLVAAVVATPFWVSVSDKIGKEKAYVVSSIYFVVPLLFCLVLPAKNLVLTSIITIMIGVGISASQVLVYAILPDVVEVDEAKNGVRREGMIYGATMFLYKISSAIFVAVATAALGWVGYVESTGSEIIEQSTSAVWGIRFLMSVLPTIFLLLSVAFVRRLSIKENKQKEAA